LNYESSLAIEQKNHISETDLDNYDLFDIHIQAESGKEFLKREIDKIFINRNIKNAFFDE
jgi:hypothetical protein